VVVLQESTEPLLAVYRLITSLAGLSKRHEHHIAFSLVGTFLVKMCHVFCKHMPEGALTQEHQPRQRFLFDRTYPAFGVGIQIGRPWR
jgi:hypothetical protein